MSGCLNQAQLVGNLGQDPEVRTLQDGGRVVTLNIATSDSWKDDKTGERKERTEWHRVVIFAEKLGSLAEQYLRKGSKVFVEGAIRTRKWQDKSGADRTSTEIQLSPYNGTLTFLDRKQGDTAADDHEQSTPPEATESGSADAKSEPSKTKSAA